MFSATIVFGEVLVVQPPFIFGGQGRVEVQNSVVWNPKNLSSELQNSSSVDEYREGKEAISYFLEARII